jgi:demethylmenaquinone methyltransferase/2-methoxy-6-polyprenyl-1,4-benzoquinol methylase
VPFRATFDCLWCGAPHTCRGTSDLEGWAQLCPDCVGKAGDNGFLRFRLHQALRERGQPEPGVAVPGVAARGEAEPASAGRSTPDPTVTMIDYYEARAPEYDDWYLRRGRYARGAIHDAAWAAELDAAGRWLDGLPIRGEIVELAAGTGWWSPLLATKGELSLYDAAPAPLERARERLVAHGLRAHLHVRDAWTPADRRVDALFAGFWVSHVPRDRLADFLAVAHGWLKPGGVFAVIDSLPDPASGAADHVLPAEDQSVRRLDDGRSFTITKVYYTRDELTDAFAQAGFVDIDASATGRFFLTVSARAA